MSEKLRKNKFFQGISDSDLAKLASLAREVQFPAMAKIFEEHDPATDIYIIEKGEIYLVLPGPDDKLRHIGVVGPGEMMGWSPLVGRTRLYHTARAGTTVHAYAFNGQKLMEFCSTNPSFGFEFMRRAACVLADRLSATRLQLLEHGGYRLPRVQPESD
jgi:CRP-like cAMP-binding protein